MKANELRIGNWYKWDTIECELTLTDFHNMEFENDIVFQPIPLTEEWLLRFGFESITDKNTIKSLDLYMCGGLVHLYSNNEDNYSRVTAWFQEDGEVSQKYFREVEFVHTLQNLYFALTGEELQIKK